MADGCMIYFRSGACDLDDARRVLAAHRLSVVRRGERLEVGRPEGPEFRVSLAEGDLVRAEAEEIGEGTSHAAALRGCDARFEIDFDSLDEALSEINTLMEVQGALQDLCQGYLFLPWNGTLTEPYRPA